MKIPIYLFAVATLTGCTIIPTPRGAAKLYGDYATIEIQDGRFHFYATGVNHSRVARVHWHGAAALGAEAVAGVVGMRSPLTGAGAAVVSPLVNRSTTRER